MNKAPGVKNSANKFLTNYRLSAVRGLITNGLRGGQNTSAERAWKILKVRNRNGYMNTRNWNRAVQDLNKYELTKNQRNIVTLTNALVKVGKPPGGGNRHRLHPNTLGKFIGGNLSGENLVSQMKRNSNARGGYKSRGLAKAAVIGGAVVLGGVAAAKYGPYVMQTIQKARNFKKNNGRVNDAEVKRLANAWKNKGFEIKNMNAFANTVRRSANMPTANQAKAQFNKAFRNGTMSMIAGGAASSLGAASLAGSGGAAVARGATGNGARQAIAAAQRIYQKTGMTPQQLQAARVAAARKAAANATRGASTTIANKARRINQGMTFGEGVQAVRRMTNSTRAGLNRARMARR